MIYFYIQITGYRVLVIYCDKTNYPKLRGLKQISRIVFEGDESGSSLAE